MLVKEMIEAIENKIIKIDELAVKYKYSDRTIQTKIKNLGFEWVAKEARYNFVGSDASVLEYSIDDVFASKNNIKNNVGSKSGSKKDVKENSKKAIVNKSEINSWNNSKNAMDKIDILLSGKKSKKYYRGFYLESDVLSVIDGLKHGNKSELVNECLRKVFKEKGLL